MRPVNGLACTAFAAWLVLAHVFAAVYSSSYRRVSMGKECYQKLQHIRKRVVDAPFPPHLTGDWTSHRCEIRSGPQYLLRKYSFTNTSFNIVQYYYSDADCINTLYGVTASGEYTIKGKSWSVVGGTELDYTLHKLYLIPYTEHFAEQMDRISRHTCPMKTLTKWESFSPQQIYRFDRYDPVLNLTADQEVLMNDYDCLAMVNLTMHDLQLMRLERRLNSVHHYGHKHREDKYIEEELRLGNVHTDVRLRPYYRPSSYQEALKRAETDACTACGRIANANEYYPPSLRMHHGSHIRLNREWVSIRCETRPHGMFLTRYLNFKSAEERWHGRYDYYTDPSCRRQSFTLYVSGSYSSGKQSMHVPGAQEYDFRVATAKIVPYDIDMVHNLNGYKGYGCGKSRFWRIGQVQDVTSTHGCVTIGISLPHLEEELLRMEHTHDRMELFIGERPTNSISGNRPRTNVRPTSFQPPLVECDSHKPMAMAYRKQHDRRHVDVKEKQQMANNGVGNVVFSSLILTLSLVILVA